MTWFLTICSGPLRKTHQVIWDALEDYGKIEWKHTLRDSEEAPDVAYQDVLNEGGQKPYCDLE